MLYAGNSTRIDRRDLNFVDTPEPTNTWTPLPHAHVLDEVEHQLQAVGIEPGRTEVAIANEGSRMFSVMDLRVSDSPDYRLVAGIRNSHDKAFSAGFCIGSSVMVCDNLCFSSDITVRRKHTQNVFADFPGLVQSAIAKIPAAKAKQDEQIWTYKGLELDDSGFDHFAMGLLRQDIFSGQKVHELLKEYTAPTFRYDGGATTLWSAFNSATHILKGYTNPLTHTMKALSLHEYTDTFAASEN